MVHFRNINDVRILSDINLYSMLEKKLEWDKAGEKAKMTVNGCSIFVFVSIEDKLESYLGCDITFNISISYENIQIATEFAKRIRGVHLSKIRNYQ